MEEIQETFIRFSAIVCSVATTSEMLIFPRHRERVEDFQVITGHFPFSDR